MGLDTTSSYCSFSRMEISILCSLSILLCTVTLSTNGRSESTGSVSTSFCASSTSIVKLSLLAKRTSITYRKDWMNSSSSLSVTTPLRSLCKIYRKISDSWLTYVSVFSSFFFRISEDIPFSELKKKCGFTWLASASQRLCKFSKRRRSISCSFSLCRV